MVKSFPERLTELEKSKDTLDNRMSNTEKIVNNQVDIINQLVQNTKDAFSVQRMTIDMMVTAMKKVVPDFGPAFDDALKQAREADKARRNEQERKQLEQLVEAGQLKVSQKVSENTVLMVGELRNKTTNEMLNNRVTVQLPSLEAALAAEFLGQSAGFEHHSKDSDEKFVVSEIFDSSEPEQPAVPPSLPETEKTTTA